MVFKVHSNPNHPGIPQFHDLAQEADTRHEEQTPSPCPSCCVWERLELFTPPLTGVKMMGLSLEMKSANLQTKTPQSFPLFC